MSIKEQYLIIDRVDNTYIGGLANLFQPSISTHITRWCVLDYPVQWDIIMEILGLLISWVKNDGWHEAFPISSGKYK